MAWVLTNREMKQTIIDEPETEVDSIPFIVTADPEGAIYIVFVFKGRFGDCARIEFYKDALVVLSRFDSRAGDCLVYKRKPKSKSTKPVPAKSPDM